MRFLGIGKYNQLGSMYLSLKNVGHDVKVFVEVPKAKNILKGLVPHTTDWKKELAWIRDAGSEGIIIFEDACFGKLQDSLRSRGFHVVGGSALGDRLESDRQFGQKIMEENGLKTAPTFPFSDFDRAIAFIRQRPGRYVYKNNGTHLPSMMNYIGEWEDGSDLIARLKFYKESYASAPCSFILMDFISGVEVGVGGYFNGSEFLQPTLLDWEHKRFFPGDLGELTGEMGTIVTYEGSQTIFKKTLEKISPHLRKFRYRGYINLNLIINDQGIWPLEFTCRFGYPGFAICRSLHEEEWDTLLWNIAHGKKYSFKTKPGFSAGVVLTTPPFPYELGYEKLSRGTPICFRSSMKKQEWDHVHFGEVSLKKGQLITAGTEGYIMVVTGHGATIPQARKKVYSLIKKIAIPNVRYRNDIGLKLIKHDYQKLRGMGYLR